jgi:hypothetical protein
VKLSTEARLQFAFAKQFRLMELWGGIEIDENAG